MPVWQMQIKMTTIQNSPTTPTVNMFQRKIDDIFKELPNAFGIANDILAVGYDNDGMDHDNTSRRVILICQKSKYEIKSRQMLFQMYVSPILWWNHFQTWCVT